MFFWEVYSAMDSSSYAAIALCSSHNAVHQPCQRLLLTSITRFSLNDTLQFKYPMQHGTPGTLHL